MANQTRLAQLTRDPNIPTPPAIALQVLQKASKPDCSLAELAKLVQLDPGLCAKILRLVNSALLGLRVSVRTVDRALQLLGLRRVRTLVLALSMPTMVTRAPTDGRLQMFWKSSLTGALAAREISARCRGADPENDFVAGLLRDLGCLVFLQVCPEEYARVLSQPLPLLARQQCQIEESILGVNHAEVGAYLLQQWHLPEEMCQSILHHHNPLKAAGCGADVFDRAQALCLAGDISYLDLVPADEDLREAAFRRAKELMGMSQAQFLAFLSPLMQQTADLAAILAVDVGVPDNLADVLRRSADQLTTLVVENNLENLRLNAEKSLAEEGRAEAEAALRDTESQLRQTQKLEAIGRLAGGVAHDFNNLLVVINGYSELAMSLLPEENTVAGMIAEVKRAGERAAGLTRQLLAFSRKQVLAPVVLDLNETISDMVRMLRRLIGENIEVHLCLGAEVCSILADPSQLEQVILNLAVNARDAMPQGGNLTIATSLLTLNKRDIGGLPDIKPGRFARLIVRDTGVGMDETVRAHLFEPFFTTKEHGLGTGLGLATVYGIVRQSGGHIAVESKPGEGAEFAVYWPYVDRPTQIARPGLAELGYGMETILLVEDDKSVRELTAYVLRSRGYEVLEAGHASQALRLAADPAQTIELVVSDIVMPGLDGPRLVEDLRKSRPWLKVLYTTGYPGNELIPRDGSPVLQKPYTPHDLAAMVSETLQQSGQLSAISVQPNVLAAR